MKAGRESVRAGWAVAHHPALWLTALVQFRRLLPDGWWRRPPFLPVPDGDLLAFRATTQYGDPDHRLETDDLVAWLWWCKAVNQRSRVG